MSSLNKISCQSVRFKGVQKWNRVNWKPIPPKTRRDAYYKTHEPMPWNYPLMKYKEQMAANADKPLPEPSEMHIVTRCKALHGQRKEWKVVCQHFGIYDKLHAPVVIPNTQSNNELLMQIKHLIRIKPLSLPNGLPEDKSDRMHCQLRTDGSLHIIKRLEPEPAIPETPTRLLQGHTIKNKNKKEVVLSRIMQDYVKTKYVWKFNEDGKEYPYKAYNAS